jgi:hypothetical protein
LILVHTRRPFTRDIHGLLRESRMRDHEQQDDHGHDDRHGFVSRIFTTRDAD